jgi:hypothetical protein
MATAFVLSIPIALEQYISWEVNTATSQASTAMDLLHHSGVL